MYIGGIIMFYEKLDELFQTSIEKNLFTGAVCSISVNEEIIYKQAFGNRLVIPKDTTSMKSDYKKMQANTMFDLASVTKMFTTTLILKLISDGKLRLDTRLIDCLPQTTHHNVNEAFASITIKQLLTHSSGISAWFPFYSQLHTDFYTIVDYVLSNYPIKKVVTYSDINYMLLAEVIKEQTQMDLKDSLNKMLVDPLQMENVCFNPTNTDNIAATEFGNRMEENMCRERNIAFNDWRRKDKPMVGEVNDGNCFYYFNGESGHAGLFATISDVLTLGHLYIKEG